MARNVYYVVPQDSGWAVKKKGAARALKLEPTQDKAIAYARGVAQKNKPSQVLVQGVDGQYRDERTYGDDPFPPRG